MNVNMGCSGVVMVCIIEKLVVFYNMAIDLFILLAHVVV